MNGHYLIYFTFKLVDVDLIKRPPLMVNVLDVRGICGSLFMIEGHLKSILVHIVPQNVIIWTGGLSK